jgi:hypothetical protein
MNLYVVLAATAGSLVLLGGAYMKGRFDEREHIQYVQLKEYRDLVQAETKMRDARSRADSDARAQAEKFINDVKRELGQVKNDFNSLPMVTVDASGCAKLNDNFRLRWNATERAASPIGTSSAIIDDVVRGRPVPAPGQF